MSARNTARCIRMVRDRDWKLYETGELYDLNADLDEELPIFESQDSPGSGSRSGQVAAGVRGDGSRLERSASSHPNLLPLNDTFVNLCF